MPDLAKGNGSRRALRVALNRLIVAGHDESLALNEAARTVAGGERRARLLHQALRRVDFRRDLSATVVELGGAPASASSYRARLSGLRRALHRLLAGPHQGDAYAACARATEKTTDAYARVLRSTMTADIRGRLEHELTEIDWDGRELRRLRWGARPSTDPEGVAAINLM